MDYHLLKQSIRPLDIEIHSDPLAVLPAALSKERARKLDKVEQAEMEDNEYGAPECLFCNPSKLHGKPEIARHMGAKVMSFPNAAPFLPGDQRVLCLWNDDPQKRYAHAHRFRFSDFGIEEFYYLVLVAVELSRAFPTTPAGQQLHMREESPIRCVAGFNLGRLAGQSIPHFHLQYGWEVALTAPLMDPALLGLFYAELKGKGLILFDDDEIYDQIYVVVPWTPKGQYHIEVHFRHKLELSELSEEDVKILSYLAMHILGRYKSEGIRNVNILFTASPYQRSGQPLIVQFVPRVNMTAVYEMMGVNVVDTPPEDIRVFFERNTSWREVVKTARAYDATYLYRKRFDPDQG